MPRLTEATKQARRRQIIDAAFTCFTAKGYTHTSMSDIIKESGLSSGSIYSHFDGKGDILHATVQQRIDMITAAYQELNTPSPRDIMRMIFSTSAVEANFTSMLRIRLEAFTVPEVQESTNTLLLPCTILLPSRSPLGVSSISRRKINANLLPTNCILSSATQRMRSSSLSRGLWCAQPCQPQPIGSISSTLH
ncbi:hypothetical protein RA11412_0643 [Rothia aeria]|uniref:HTH tetR-type domain-containing protein n=1 Tax=Rothia aeria TaxID=172042 RepID=A0A2Z5QWZ3_9MICC|nr:hypothetical protein RA11412_0643 [Rothia aeria]